ncbi:MAG: YgiW/YdeI family stress tolerance OB fold protein [Rhodocyclaceae bacterium]|nr:YgiW/YdeI family stress tolerance OB fold protein [Rhodocyclaceae bacterium]
MRTTILSAAFVLGTAMSAALPAQAQTPAPAAQAAVAPGGFQGPMAQAQVTTVAEARKARDDTPVTLTGHIVQRLPHDDDDYLFRDNTGEIEVDIDHKVFRGQNVTPQTRVRISGEVDQEFMKATSIDVEFLEVL